MTDEQWKKVKQFAACEPVDEVPLGLIVDSPWIPGYCGVSTIDFYANERTWLKCHEKIKADFPDTYFFPDYWMEIGMAAEPSAYGCRPRFFPNQPVSSDHLIEDPDDIDQICDLPVPNPKKDGLMPLAIEKYKSVKDILHDKGEKIRMVCSRGPLNIASFLMSVPAFCMALKIYPDEMHKIIKNTTTLVKNWLEAQMEVLDYVDGIMVLDDLCGYMSEDDYLEFGQPYLKEIFGQFDVPVKMFHNDNFGNTYATFPYIEDAGINIFNFSFKADINVAREKLGDKVCILGNIPPLDVLTEGTPEQCAEAATKLLNAYGSKQGLILSAGGGASMGMPKENFLAVADALREWNKK